MMIQPTIKDGNDNPVCETAKETQMYRTVLWTLGEDAEEERDYRTHTFSLGSEWFHPHVGCPSSGVQHQEDMSP